MKKLYVVGFLFNNSGKVALIQKNRPEWQRGKLNGIGRHIESGETPYQAMCREFNEEAGDYIEKWEQYCSVEYPEAIIHFFRLFGDYTAETKTDEMVSWYPIANLPDITIPNLYWLIPLALYTDDYKITVFGGKVLVDSK